MVRAYYDVDRIEIITEKVESAESASSDLFASVISKATQSAILKKVKAVSRNDVTRVLSCIGNGHCTKLDEAVADMLNIPSGLSIEEVVALCNYAFYKKNNKGVI